MGTVKLPIHKVRPGMIAGADIVYCGIRIVSKGDKLTKKSINLIKYNGFTAIPVLDSSLKRSKDYSTGDYISFFDKTANNEIEKISGSFINQVKNLRSQLNSILKGNEKISVSCLLDNIKIITNEAKNPYRLFEAMYSMKDFDDDTYIHSLNVSLVATVLAEWVNMPAEEIDKVSLAGLLHDIGKTQIPKEIINKPGRLTPEEFEVVKQHSMLGYSIVKDLDIPESVKLAVLQHHEKCDGSGYPYGLKAEEINDISKIITIADIYDAMTSTRCYRGPICPFEVVQTFEEEGTKKYEPKFLFPFFKGIIQSYVNKCVELSNGEIGEVILIHQHDITRPLVKTKDRFINLSVNRDISIKRII